LSDIWGLAKGGVGARKLVESQRRKNLKEPTTTGKKGERIVALVVFVLQHIPIFVKKKGQVAPGSSNNRGRGYGSFYTHSWTVVAIGKEGRTVRRGEWLEISGSRKDLSQKRKKMGER